jgi:hypothetical protein
MTTVITWLTSASKLVGLAIVILLGIALAFAAQRCVAGATQTNWELWEPPEGTEFQVAVWVGGCDEYDRMRVMESDEAVLIKAYIRDDVKEGCDDGIFIEEKTVRLDAPLGNRPLMGCNPPGSPYGGGSDPPNDDCVASIVSADSIPPRTIR